MILTHKFHGYVANPKISLMFKIKADYIKNVIYEDYETCIVQDQVLYIWLLSTISERVLLQIFTCKRSYEIWDKIHKHFSCNNVRVRWSTISLPLLTIWFLLISSILTCFVHFIIVLYIYLSIFQMILRNQG